MPSADFGNLRPRRLLLGGKPFERWLCGTWTGTEIVSGSTPCQADSNFGGDGPVDPPPMLFGKPDCIVRSGPGNQTRLPLPFGRAIFVSYDIDQEYATLDTNLGSTHALLSAVMRFAPHCRFYFAASSEMFGNAETSPQNESTPFNPRSVYGISKLAGFHLCKSFRENEDVFASSGILYNHESPRRGKEYVTKKSFLKPCPFIKDVRKS